MGRVTGRPSATGIERPGWQPKFGGLDGISLIVGAVMVTTSAMGLLVDGAYRDNPWATAAFRGTDAATLILAVPVLLGALVLARRGSLRARLVWLGVLAYNVYNYGFYLFGTTFNDLFLLYAAGMGLSIILLVFATPKILPAVATPANAPYRLVGGYLIVVGLMFGLVWAARSLDFVLNDRMPTVITDSGLHTSIVFALDLALVVPWLVIAGVLLWRRSQSGIVLGVVMNVLAVLYMAALATAGAFMADAGIAGMVWSAPPYLEIGVASAVALAVLLPKVSSASHAEDLTDALVTSQQPVRPRAGLP